MDAKVKILIADDDPNVRKSLALYLDREGMQVINAQDGAEAVDMTMRHKPSLVVLDIMMPKKDGLAACREIRAFSNVPIIMLTAKGEEIDKLLGLELGADDYVTKPFSPREVVARIKVVLRRVSDAPEAPQEARDIELEGLTLSHSARTLTVRGEQVSVTPKEFDILYLLMSNPKQVFSREALLEKVWGYDFYGDTRTVDTHIKRIRSKIGESDRWELRTVWGVGYSFDVK